MSRICPTTLIFFAKTIWRIQTFVYNFVAQISSVRNMIDRIKLKTPITDNEVLNLLQSGLIEPTTRGRKRGYISTKQTEKFRDLHLVIDESGFIEVVLSLHKFYSVLKNGTLDNSTQFTYRQAKEAFTALCDWLGIDLNEAKVLSYEIGINISMPRTANEYTKEMSEVSQKNLGEDMRYLDKRQITTSKTPTKRVFFKIYDKTAECTAKGRKPSQPYILRVECVFKRQNFYAVKLWEDAKKIRKAFFDRCDKIEFNRPLMGVKGVRESEKNRAEKIISSGVDAYKRQVTTDYNNKYITRSEFQTNMRFADEWETKHKSRFYKPVTKVESEFWDEYRTIKSNMMSANNT